MVHKRRQTAGKTVGYSALLLVAAFSPSAFADDAQAADVTVVTVPAATEPPADSEAAPGPAAVEQTATAEPPAAPAQTVTATDGKPKPKAEAESEIDPYEDFNRAMFSFNDYVDDYVAKPISDAYLWAAPGFLKSGVTNFFSNLKDISVILNDHMQGKFEQGFEDTGRLLANSSLGLLGFFDVATDLGLQKHEEDFGQTLAVWGVPSGSYLVLPLLGPTTTRGLPGSVVDAAANPSFYVGMPVQLVSMLNTRANAEGALKFVNEAAIDPYVFTREAYLQNQRHLISDGKESATVSVLPLEDEIFDDDTPATAKPPAANAPALKPEEAAVAAVAAEIPAPVVAAEPAAEAAQFDEAEKPAHRRKHRKKTARKTSAAEIQAVAAETMPPAATADGGITTQ